MLKKFDISLLNIIWHSHHSMKVHNAVVAKTTDNNYYSTNVKFSDKMREAELVDDMLRLQMSG